MQKIYYNYAAFSISFRFITIFLVKCYHTDVDAMDFRVWRQRSLHLFWRPAEQGNNGNKLFFRHLLTCGNHLTMDFPLLICAQ